MGLWGLWNVLRARSAAEVRPKPGAPGGGEKDPGKAQNNLQCHLSHEDGCEDVVRHREEDAFLKEWEKQLQPGATTMATASQI